MRRHRAGSRWRPAAGDAWYRARGRLLHVDGTIPESYRHA
jgi:hypothetical protein